MVIERDDGARQVFRRPMDMLNMSDRDLRELYYLRLDMSSLNLAEQTAAQEKVNSMKFYIKHKLKLGL